MRFVSVNHDLGVDWCRASHLLIGLLVGRPQFVPVYVPNIIVTPSCCDASIGV